MDIPLLDEDIDEIGKKLTNDNSVCLGILHKGGILVMSCSGASFILTDSTTFKRPEGTYHPICYRFRGKSIGCTRNADIELIPPSYIDTYNGYYCWRLSFSLSGGNDFLATDFCPGCYYLTA